MMEKPTFPPFGTIPTRPRCHQCGDVIVCDILVPDDLWLAVFRETHGPGYCCLNCFASRADEKLLEWCSVIKLRPISLVAQMKIQADAVKRTHILERDK